MNKDKDSFLTQGKFDQELSF